jgi:integrase
VAFGESPAVGGLHAGTAEEMLWEMEAQAPFRDHDRIRGGLESRALEGGIAPPTVLRDVAALSGVPTRAVKMGKLEPNPVRNVDKPRIDRRPKVRYLSVDEESRLRTVLANRDEDALAARRSANEWRRARQRVLLPEPERFADHLSPAVLLSINTGLRRDELLSLLWDDVATEEKLLTVRGISAKSGDSRYIPLND